MVRHQPVDAAALVLELPHRLLERTALDARPGCVTGTRTSVRNTSQKCRLVVMSVIGRTSMPGVLMGTMISLMPACGGPSVDVRQMR